MRAVAVLRNLALLAFFVLLVGGVLLNPARTADASARASAEGGVYRAG